MVPNTGLGQNDGGYVQSSVCERVCKVGPGRYSFWCRGGGTVLLESGSCPIEILGPITI